MGFAKEPALEMEFYPLTLMNLIDFEYKSKQHWPVYMKRKLFFGIVLGLEACHIAGVAHMDLKCDNILLSDLLVPTVCDFGLARMLTDSHDILGWTDTYASPEVKSTFLRMGGYDWRSHDLWTLGVVLCEMMFLFTPDVFECRESRRDPILGIPKITTNDKETRLRL